MNNCMYMYLDISIRHFELKHGIVVYNPLAFIYQSDNQILGASK